VPTVLITPESMLHVQAPYVTILKEGGFDIHYPKNPQLARGLVTDAETIDELRGMNAIIAGGEHFNPAVIAALPDLKVIARAGVGYDRVNVPAATKHKVALTITPTANHEAVAEHVFAIMLASAKHVVRDDKNLRIGKWSRQLTQPIRGRTFGLLGLGRIGRSTAIRGVAMGMKVIACETFPNLEFVRSNKIELVDLETLLARSDYLSLHCPLNDQTRGLVNAAFLAKMKPGSTLVNSARGGLVVEKDLIAALTSGHLRAAALDVFEEEPTRADNPLFALDNVVVTPHLAGTDENSLENMGIECAESIVSLYKGRWPDGSVVNNELRETWKW
jgi:D-3-phosphoglycerate dehydrogenase